MKFWLNEWQHKGYPFTRALLDSGDEIDENNPDFVLFDHDVSMNRTGWRSELVPFINRKIKIFLYPHGAHPITLWDGVYQPCPNITANFVPAVGHQEVMKRYGYPIQTIPVGFPFCKIKPFRATTPGLVVFAPIHPLRSGFVQPEDKEINKNTMRKLLATGLPILVRYIGTIEQNGLKFESGVEYVQATPDGSIEEIEKASLVVAAGTYLYLSVASGTPSISIRERQRPFWGKKYNKVYASRWSEYSGYMGYPYDENDYVTLEDKVILNCMTNESDLLKNWKKLFIGKQFNGKDFAHTIHKLVRNKE